MNLMQLLTPNKVGFFEGSFFSGRGGVIWPPTRTLHISRITYPDSIQLCKIVKQPIWSKIKLKIDLHRLLYTHAISIFGTKKYQKVFKIDDNS